MQIEGTTIYDRPDLVEECFDLLQSEWPVNPTTRRNSLIAAKSKNQLPAHLILLQHDTTPRVIAHCAIRSGPDPQIAILLSVVVRLHLRGKGIGKLLMRYAEEYCAAKSIPLMYLWTKDQVGFYRGLGYEQCAGISKVQHSRSSLNPSKLNALECTLSKRLERMEPRENIYSVECLWMRKRIFDEFPMKSIPMTMTQEAIKRELILTKVIASKTDVEAFHVLPTPWTRQIGPSCGIAALKIVYEYFISKAGLATLKISELALHNPPNLDLVKVLFYSENKSRPLEKKGSTLLEYAIDNNLSTEGEMFSTLYMLQLAHEYLGMYGVEIVNFNSDMVVKLISIGIPLLIAYDRDDNHRPCKRNGKSAHWGVVKGVGVIRRTHDPANSCSDGNESTNCSCFNHSNVVSCDINDIWIVLSQGLSEKDIIVSYADLYESNHQLTGHQTIFANGCKWKIPESGVRLKDRVIAIMPWKSQEKLLFNQIFPSSKIEE